MHRVRHTLLSCVVALAVTAGLHAQYIWTGQSPTNGSVEDDLNWQGNLAPEGTSGTDNVIFGDIAGTQTTVLLPFTVALGNITLNGSERPNYLFTNSAPESLTSLTLTGNLTVTAGSPNNSPATFQDDIDITLSNAINSAHIIDIAATSVEVKGSISESGTNSLVKSGTGTLELSGYNTYSGGTTVNGGTLLVHDNYQALGTGTVTVNSGATLQVSNGGLSNTMVFNAGSTLTGSGHITNATIGSGVTISPGDSAHTIGDLSFDDLTLGQNSNLVLDVLYNGEGGFYSDSLSVFNPATLTIEATVGQPMNLKLVSLSSSGSTGALTGLVLGQTYFLEFLYANGISGDFTLGQNLLLDTSAFDTGGVDVTFDLFRNGNNYKLAFTAVPEPSTYALMALGLGFIGLTVWRRRRTA